MTTATLDRQQDWISAREAADALGVGAKAVRRLAQRGMIGVRAIPNTHPKFSAEDVRRVATTAVRPAFASA
jgi:predicted site-specific integrase-resolvase